MGDPTGAARRAPQPQGIKGVVWRLWPWMSWILPVFFAVHGFLGTGGGWTTVILAVVSPLLIPAAGLLGALPRFLLRRRGHTMTPAPVVWPLLLHWCAWIALTLTMPGRGDGGSLPSLLQQMLGVPMASSLERGLCYASTGVAVVSWAVVLVLAIRLGDARAPERRVPAASS